MKKHQTRPRGRRALYIATMGTASALGLGLPLGNLAGAEVVDSQWQVEQGSWNNAANWAPQRIPNNSGNAVFNVTIGAGGDVALDLADVTVATVTLDATLSLQANATAAQVLVGSTGWGNVTQSTANTTCTIRSDLILGQSHGDNNVPDSHGEWCLTAGTLDASVTTIGDFGAGYFTQAGGECRAGALTLGLSRFELLHGPVYAGFGRYNLFGNTELPVVRLLPISMVVGNEGEGEVEQLENTLNSINGGTGTLTLADQAESVGSYLLASDAGVNFGLRAGEEIVGNDGNGSFSHSSGRNVATNLRIGAGMGTGSYDIWGGELKAADINIGQGQFTQSGGTTTVTNTILVSGPRAIFELSAGDLTTRILRVTGGAARQTGGQASVTGAVDLPGWNDGFLMQGGFMQTASIQGQGLLLVLGGQLIICPFPPAPVLAWSGARGTISPGAELQFATDNPYMVDAGTFSNAGRLVLNSSASMDAVGGTTITNDSGGVIDVKQDGGLFSTDATAIINNNFGGTLTKSAGTGTSTIGVILNNSGTVSAASGTLDLVGGGTHTGNFTASNGATLAFSAGTHTFTGGTISADSWDSASTVAFSGASCTFNGTAFQPTYGSAVTFSSGTCTFNSAIFQPETGSAIAFTGGSHTLANGTTFYTASGATNTLAGGAITIAGTVYNYGTLTLDGAQLDGTGTLANSGTLTGQSIAVTCSTLTINNSGTFRFTGYTPSHFDGTLNNTGTVAAPGGVLALAGGGTHTGTFSGYVSFTGGTHTFNSGYAFSPGSHIGFSGADIVVNADWYAQTMVDPVTISLESGSVSGPGSLNLNEGTFNWTGGTLGSAVSVCRVAMYAGTINISGESKSLSGALTNSGTASTINWSGGDIDITGGSGIVNGNACSLNITTDSSITSSGGSPTLENYGIITKSQSDGTTTIAVPATMVWGGGTYNTLNVQTGTLSFTAAFSINGSAGKSGDGTLSISGSQSHSSGASLAVNAGSLVMTSNAGGDSGTSPNLSISVADSASATFDAANQNLAGLSIAEGGLATLHHAGSGAYVVMTVPSANFSIAGGDTSPTGLVDVRNNTLTIAGLADGSDHAAVAARVRSLLIAGRSGGTWTGNGISSGMAADNSDTALGYKDTGTSTLVKYTWGGDATLDQTVNFNDLSALMQHYGQTSGGTWAFGDFNYDERINFNDMSILSQHYGYQPGGLPTDGEMMMGMSVSGGSALQRLALTPEELRYVGREFGAAVLADVERAFGYWDSFDAPGMAEFAAAPVPEPGTMSVLAIGAAGLLARRRRIR